MSIRRNCFWITVWATSLVCSFISAASAESLLQGAIHDDWAGYVSELALPDGSTLFEYRAQTVSSTVGGATLSLSFFPRFNCQPTLSVRLPQNYWPESADFAALLDIEFDDQAYQYPALIDEEPGFKTYSISTSVEQFRELRQLVDLSIHAKFQIARNPDAGTEQKDPPQTGERTAESSDSLPSIDYSLLGSRQVVGSTELYCKQHEPIPYAAQ